MSGDLDLTLDMVKKKKKDRTALVLSLLVLVAVLSALNAVYLFRSPRGASGDPAVLEKLALKLEKQELYGAAADTWTEYIRAAAPQEAERARIWYRIGKMREQSGDCESALAAYYRSEMTAGLPGLEREISMAAERCLTRLARFAALRSELAERTTLDGGSAGDDEVLAEIGTKRITRGMLEAMIEAEVDAQVAQVAAGMPAGQVREQRAKILDQVMKETDMGMWLERLVAEELLFRYAMEENLHEDPEISEMSRRIERKLLTSQVLAREYAKSVTVSEDEMRAWYRDNGASLAAGDGLEGGEVPPFDDVKDRVHAAVRAEKEMAVQAALLRELTDKYDAVIHTSRMGGEEKERKQ